MPEIEFSINVETGECQTEIKGVSGAACERTARALKQLLGDPAVDQKTKEYFAQPEIKRQVKGK